MLAGNGTQANMANNRAQILISPVDQSRGAFAAIERNLGDLGDQPEHAPPGMGSVKT